MKQKPIIISFSGGRSSALMLWHLLKKYRFTREIIVLFCNTSKEREETLVFVNERLKALLGDVLAENEQFGTLSYSLEDKIKTTVIKP